MVMCRLSRGGGRKRSGAFHELAAAVVVAGSLCFSEESEDWPIARLSTGERLRLALVRALMVGPKVLLLDEPTGALDPASVSAVEELVSARVRAGLAVLWVTHDVKQASRVLLSSPEAALTAPCRL